MTDGQTDRHCITAYTAVKIEDMFIGFVRMYDRDRHMDRLMDRHSITAKASTHAPPTE